MSEDLCSGLCGSTSTLGKECLICTNLANKTHVIVREVKDEVPYEGMEEDLTRDSFTGWRMQIPVDAATDMFKMEEYRTTVYVSWVVREVLDSLYDEAINRQAG